MHTKNTREKGWGWVKEEGTENKVVNVPTNQEAR